MTITVYIHKLDIKNLSSLFDENPQIFIEPVSFYYDRKSISLDRKNYVAVNLTKNEYALLIDNAK